jgi:hypothetical protein
MATYNLTNGSVAGGATVTAGTYPDVRNQAYMIEATLDIPKLIAAGAFSSAATGDIFELLTVPAGSLVVAAGAEVITAFNGTTPLVDIDFAAGDDIVDAGDVATLGYLAGGTNGTVIGTATANYTQFVTTADTIDVKLAVTGSVTTGKLRVFAVVVDCNSIQKITDEVDRDQLA